MFKTNLRRQIECIRFVPLRQLTRRAYLLAKRRVIDRKIHDELPPLEIKPEFDVDPAKLPISSAKAPHGSLTRTASGWNANFLNESRPMPETIEWHSHLDSGKNQLWRMNLHYFEFLPDLDTDSAEYLIEDWIKKCRPGSRSASKSSWTPYAISLRLSAWLDYWSTNGPFGSDNFRRELTSSVGEQADYLSANLETDILGNHIIKNIRALYEAAYFLRRGPDTKWVMLADKWLASQIETQILPDGVHFELSLSYHAQVFADLLQVYSLQTDDKPPRKLEKTLDNMIGPLIDLCHPDSYPIQFNDAGLNMCASVIDCEKIYKRLRQRSYQANTGAFDYPAAGFYGFRSIQNFCVVKMGKLGPDELMAHAHSDWGSFEWSHKNQRVIIDQGVYEYFAGPKRNQSRSNVNHNTGTIDNIEQAEFIGSFRCAFRPSPKVTTYQADSQGFELEGQLRVAGVSPANAASSSLIRKFRVSSDGIEIEDTSTAASTLLSSAALLHPDWTPRKTSENQIQMSNREGTIVYLSLLEGSAISIEAAVWWPNMGYEIETNRIRITGNPHKIRYRLHSADTKG